VRWSYRSNHLMKQAWTDEDGYFVLDSHKLQ